MVREILSRDENEQDFSKFASDQSVLIELGDLGESEEIGKEKFIHLQITVRDSGIGIKKEQLKHLFMDFGKLDDDEGRNKGGTGLGLSICKQIIEQMGGSVEVKSKVGRGTDFIINLKMKGKVAKVELDASEKAMLKPFLEDITSNEISPSMKNYLKLMEAKPCKDGIHSIVRIDKHEKNGLPIKRKVS